MAMIEEDDKILKQVLRRTIKITQAWRISRKICFSLFSLLKEGWKMFA